MKKLIAAAFCLVASSAQAHDDQAQGDRAQGDKGGWVTFKIVNNSRGKIEHQIERRTVKQEGRYKSFWTRIWVVKEKQAQVFSANEQLFFSAQKYLVDCPGRRFGTDYIDSVTPRTEKYATVQTMHWASLDEFPAVAKTVCDEK
jgi:hypothetical protein